MAEGHPRIYNSFKLINYLQPWAWTVIRGYPPKSACTDDLHCTGIAIDRRVLTAEQKLYG